MWNQKYRPRALEEIAGNPKLVADLRAYDWKKPLIIYGPAGTGKSTLVEAIARDRDYELVAVTDENMASAKYASQTASMFGRKKLIYIDNVELADNIKAVGELIAESKNPVIMTTGDFASKRLATIKKSCEKLQMRKPTTKTVEKMLQHICAKEGVECDANVLLKIAENASGDIRSAINDLETVAKGRKKITAEDAAVLDKRDTTSDIYHALSIILTKKDFTEAVRSLWDLEEQPKDILLWIDENMPHVYTTKEDIGRAYEYLAEADMFIGRITRRQYWGFLRYASTLMSGGVNAAKKSGVRFTMYRFPSYLITMSQTKKAREMNKRIGAKLSPYLHASNRVIAKEFIPLLRTLLSKEKITKEELMKDYRLDEEEIEYLAG
jgi:replication factor C large subunit